MSEFLTDPSVLTKDKLKSALVANNVALPNGDQRKGVYVELYLKNLTSQNKKNTSPDAFSSDEDLGPMVSNKSRSGRKATKKTDRVPPEEIDVVELTDECLKDQLLKYGVNAGPIVASTRKLYEKRLQKLLEAGVPEALVPSSEHVHTGRSHNGTTHADQYSDVEGETTTIPEPEPEPEPEPVPVVERTVRSRGKLSVTPRTLSSQHRAEESEELDGELQVWNIRRKSRRSSRRLDQAVPASDDTDFSELSASETLPPPCERKTTRPMAIPRDPIPLLADKPSGFSPVSRPSFPESPTVPVHSALDACRENFLDEEFYERSQFPEKSTCSQRMASTPWQRDSKDTYTDTHTLSSRALKTGPVDIKPKRVLLTKQHRSASTPPSRELVHVMCRLSPHPASPRPLSVMDSSAQPLSPKPLMDSSSLPAREVPLPITKSLSKEHTGSSMARSKGRQTDPGPLPSPVTPVRGQDFSCGEQSLGVLIERLSYVEQTPKTAERNVLKEMFPNENLSTPTGISATCRPPIKGAAGRSLSDAWLDELRPRLTELRQTSSSYTESRSVPRVSAIPFPASRPTAPSAVQAKARRRIPVWVRLLLLGAVAVFLFLVYQAMETNEMSPFGQGASSALDSTSK